MRAIILCAESKRLLTETLIIYNTSMQRDELITAAAIVRIGIFILDTDERMAQNATTATNKTMSQILGYNHGYFQGSMSFLSSTGGYPNFCDAEVNGTKSCASSTIGYNDYGAKG